MSSTERRIVVTGIGWVTPMGHDIETVWQRLLNGETDITPIERFDARTFPTTFASQIRDYDWTGFVKDPAIHGQPGKHTQFALGAARQAWTMSGLDDATNTLAFGFCVSFGGVDDILYDLTRKR